MASAHTPTPRERRRRVPTPSAARRDPRRRGRGAGGRSRGQHGRDRPPSGGGPSHRLRAFPYPRGVDRRRHGARDSEVVESSWPAEPESGDPADALCRVVTEAWRKLGRYHALVAINTQLPARRAPPAPRRRPRGAQALIERGQRTGVPRDVPAAWHLSMMMALIHAASAELRAARLPAEEIEAALVATVLGALGRSP